MMVRISCPSWRPSERSGGFRGFRLLAAAVVGLLLAGSTPASAQGTGTIQVSVVDSATQRPLADVQVTVVGTTLGARTSQTGGFQITNVPAGAHTVRAARIGYTPSERQVTVGEGRTSTVSFSISQGAVALEGIVVTALGITRDERSLSTSVQSVQGSALTEARESNLVAALSGKVAGVQITNSNTAGGSSRIVIRGANSLTGGNQPLFVVDGIPVSNSAGFSGTRGYNGVDYGNAISDINPNDIESITVLKGPNAAALYGSRAANGAIIVTTKSGRRGSGTQVTASVNTTFETPLRLPDYQNRYGQGWNGEFNYLDGKGGGTRDDYDESWGPRLDAGNMACQFDSPRDETGACIPTPLVSNPNNVRDFFETGRTTNSNLAFTASADRANVRLSLSRMDQDGMIPGFGMERTNVSLHGASNITPRLRTDASVQYISHSARNRPAQGYGGSNPMWQFLWFGRQVDINSLRERTRNPDGTQYNWNNIWSNNPYFVARENLNTDGRDRIVGNVSVAYDVLPWLSATVRTGTDWYEENRRQQYAAGSYSISGVDANGALGVQNLFRQETNTDFLLQASIPNTGDDWTVNVDFGGNRRDNTYRYNDIYIRNLAIPGVYSYSNYVEPPTVGDYRERRAVNSLYAQTRLGFRDYLFLDLSGRNDWSSTLPDGNNSYFYPAVSSSLVFSELVEIPGLSFGRLRGGWAQVGNDAAPYQLEDGYGFDIPFGNAPRLTASNTLRNANLKPEKTASWEFGTDLRFLDDRLGLGATYYQKATTNQLVNLEVSAMTGFTGRYINAGKISNRGMELMVDATPVRLDNGFEWNVTANYSRDRAFVDELYEDMETITLGTYYSVSVQARKGERYGAMYGRKYVRDGEGNIVVGSNGLPLNSASNPIGYLGNYNPDWVAGLGNTFRYRGLELGVLFDVRKGGNIYSLTNFYGRRSGVLVETLEGRENSLDDRLIVKGVRVDASGDTIPNDIQVTAQNYHRSLGNSGGISEEFTYDASFIKLRELRLSYDVPPSFSERLRVANMRVALVGRNLWLSTDVPHIDPETAFDAGNAQGFEYSQMPSARSFGINFTVTP